MDMNAIDFNHKFSLFTEQWSPKVIGSSIGYEHFEAYRCEKPSQNWRYYVRQK
jgi:hypothetical protein